MVRSLDESVGRVWQRLRDLKIDDNTIVVFTSDNGGYIGTSAYAGKQQVITSNWPLRSGKASLYEGGLRVPLIVHWPGVTATGQTTSQPVVLTDLFPTLLESVVPGAQAKVAPLDGVNLSKVLRAPDERLPDRDLYFHYPHYYHAPATTPCGAIRSGNWKLIEWFEDERVELYNLTQDEREQNDLSQSNPSRATELRDRLAQWRTSVGAAMPQRRAK